jgi:hypothetical protein
MKNGVFWDIKTQFVPHRKNNVSTTESSRLMLCKIWGFHSIDYEECRLLGNKTHFVPHRKHITSRRMVSSGMLRRVTLVRADVSEEPSATFTRVTRICELGTTLAATRNWHTLRRNTNTSNLTHYISATEPSQLMLCKIWGFHSSDYEECRLL